MCAHILPVADEPVVGQYCDKPVLIISITMKCASYSSVSLLFVTIIYVEFSSVKRTVIVNSNFS